MIVRTEVSEFPLLLHLWYRKRRFDRVFRYQFKISIADTVNIVAHDIHYRVANENEGRINRWD